MLNRIKAALPTLPIAGILIAFLLPGAAVAVTGEEYRTVMKESTWQAIGELETLKDRLADRPVEQWTVQDTKDYLGWVLMAVGWAKSAANALHDKDHTISSADLTALVDLGYLPYWPANPFNDWKAMRVLSPEDEFSPGDLVFQECPPDAYSYSWTPGGPAYPRSYALSAFGPTPDFGKEHQTVTFSSDRNPWVIERPEAVYVVGVSHPAAAAVDAQHEQRQRESQEVQE